MEERLQKIISRAGIASRRAGEEIILAGRVRVNGRIVTELGAKADLGRDTIEVDGRRLVHETPLYVVLHKPRGVVSTLSDPEGRPTVAGLIEGAGARLYPVGRLDFATSGVLLVTNDGDFANGLLHPRGGVPKTYVVKARGQMSEDDLDRWRTGVPLEDGVTLPAEVRFLRHEEDKTWFEITLREGRNQQIRRMGEATGFPVMRLARTSFAGITSEGIRPGEWRSLTVDELIALRERFGVPRKIRRATIAGARASGAPARSTIGGSRASGAPARSTTGGSRASGAPARSTIGGSRASGATAPHNPRSDGAPKAPGRTPRARTPGHARPARGTPPPPRGATGTSPAPPRSPSSGHPAPRRGRQR
jgi:23S rRNA pseudouridine2605 synthase